MNVVDRYKRYPHTSVNRNIIAQQYGVVKHWNLCDVTRSSKNFIQRLQCYSVLEGHSGCVNTVSWNATGSLLLSGSDDYLMNIYDIFRGKKLHSVESGHRANIFSAKFLPCTSDLKIVSCSGDGMLHYNEIGTNYGENFFNCHSGTTYEVLVTPGDPNTFLSCGEDGTVRLFDLRSKSKCHCQECSDDILIDTRHAVTSISLNPMSPYHLAAGCKDSFVRVFDRRTLGTSVNARSVNRNKGWMPGLFCKFKPEKLRKDASCRITSLKYSNDGKDILVSYCTDYVYTFTLNDEQGNILNTNVLKSEKSFNTNGDKSSNIQNDDSDGLPPVKRLRLRGDWSDTGPQARPETFEENCPENNLMQRMTELFSRWLDDALNSPLEGLEGENSIASITSQDDGEGNNITDDANNQGSDTSVFDRNENSDSEGNILSREILTEHDMINYPPGNMDSLDESCILSLPKEENNDISNSSTQDVDKGNWDSCENASNSITTCSNFDDSKSGNIIPNDIPAVESEKAVKSNDNEFCNDKLNLDHKNYKVISSVLEWKSALPVNRNTVGCIGNSDDVNRNTNSKPLCSSNDGCSCDNHGSLYMSNKANETMPILSAIQLNVGSELYSSAVSSSNTLDLNETEDKCIRSNELSVLNSPESYIREFSSRGDSDDRVMDEDELLVMEHESKFADHEEGQVVQCEDSDDNFNAIISSVENDVFSDLEREEHVAADRIYHHNRLSSTEGDNIIFSNNNMYSNEPDNVEIIECSNNVGKNDSLHSYMNNDISAIMINDSEHHHMDCTALGTEGGQTVQHEISQPSTLNNVTEERSLHYDGREASHDFYDDIPLRDRAAVCIQKFLRYHRSKPADDNFSCVHKPIFIPSKYTVFKGHRNARTMIKEANFWGNDYVLSGSDCGRIFIWDRHTSELVMLLQGDSHVVNCVQPHPFDPILASSGIDHDIKIWAPLAEYVPNLTDMEEIVNRNEKMLEESRDTITVPASFVLRMLASFGSMRRRRTSYHSMNPDDNTDDPEI